ncbi:hypothetical protein QUF84_25115 [Fictibacillus enclensis]|uniref:hypothetical protein n=1 Tax=Fictibacillus enclensis TaxID=1017270 RepID=UPI0025A2388C|nr:hypothetical protein [Fictibacillus enclensis]MDM5340478.1 hypothetical protein [Fictibacillus enclensis]
MKVVIAPDSFKESLAAMKWLKPFVPALRAFFLKPTIICSPLQMAGKEPFMR